MNMYCTINDKGCNDFVDGSVAAANFTPLPGFADVLASTLYHDT
jgi:hypothetical protein